MKKVMINTLLKVICDVTIGTGAGQFRFVTGERVRADDLTKHGIAVSPRYFAEVVKC